MALRTRASSSRASCEAGRASMWMATAASLVQPTSWRTKRSSRSTEHCVTRQMASWRAAGWSDSGQRRRAA
eukprot:6545729-Alexandrium_andersonii.AAC.1